MIGILASLGVVLGTASPASAAVVTIGGKKYDVTSWTMPHSGSYEQAGYQIAYSSHDNRVWTTSTYHEWVDAYGWVAKGSTINAFNKTTGAFITSITPATLTGPTRVEAAYGLAVEEDPGSSTTGDVPRNRLWTTSSRENSVVVYNEDTGAKITTITGVEHGRDIVIDTRRNRAYVSGSVSGKMYVINTINYSIIATLTSSNLGSTSGNFSPMSLDGIIDSSSSVIYTVNIYDGRVLRLNFSSSATAPTVSNLGNVGSNVGANGVAVNKDAKKLYVTTQSSYRLYRFSFSNILTGSATGSSYHTYGAQLLNVATEGGVNGRVFVAGFGTSSSPGERVLICDVNGVPVNGTGGAPLSAHSYYAGKQVNDVAVFNSRVWSVDRGAAGYSPKLTMAKLL